MSSNPACFEADYDLLRTDVGAVIGTREAVSISGPDAAGFLQGQLSQDISALGVGESAPSLLLSPQGKLVAWLRVTVVGEASFVLDVDHGFGGAVAERLEKFKLRTKVDIALEHWGSVSLRGPRSGEIADSYRSPAIPADPVVVRSGWPGVEGFDVLGGGVGLLPGVAEVSRGAFDTVRVEAGVPAMGYELGERTIPAEAGLVEASVSFTKGCYTGQELVARIDSRGSNVARRLRGVLSDAEGIPRGAEMVVGDKVVGSLTSVGWSGVLGSTVALGYVRRGTDPGDEVDIRWDGGSAQGTIRELPLV